MYESNKETRESKKSKYTKYQTNAGRKLQKYVCEGDMNVDGAATMTVAALAPRKVYMNERRTAKLLPFPNHVASQPIASQPARSASIVLLELF